MKWNVTFVLILQSIIQCFGIYKFCQKLKIMMMKVNFRIFTSFKLVLDCWTSLGIELFLECMLEWMLENNISRLKGAGAICWNKYHTHTWVFLFHPTQKLSTFVNWPIVNQPNHLLVFCQCKFFHLSYMIRFKDVFNKLFGGF